VADTLPTVIPMLSYEDAGAAADWLVQAFGFRERHRFADDDGTVLHAELELGDGVVMLGSPPGYVAPRRHRESCDVARRTYSSSYVVDGTLVYVDDVDAHAGRAREAGAALLSEPEDQPYGDRTYRVEDLEGHRWMFSKHLHDVAAEDWGATATDVEAQA
jgi:uncharacterized glyoxalase superfamily protein PhnB